MAMRASVIAAHSPHRPVSTAMDPVPVTFQATITRPTRSTGTRCSLAVANSGLNTPIQVMRASSTTMTSTTPAAPGITRTSHTGHTARSAPETTRTRPRPYLAARPVASRAPTKPPIHGNPKAIPYCHAAQPMSPSRRTAISGSVAMMSALTATVFQNSRSNCRSALMNFHPSVTSETRNFAAFAVDPTRSGSRIIPILNAERRNPVALPITVTTGPRALMAPPPSVGPTAVAVHVVDSNLPLAVRRWSGRTICFR